MEQWVRSVLPAGHGSLEALLLGVLGSIGSCCNLPVLGAVAGYAGGVAAPRSRRMVLLLGVAFAAGSVISLLGFGAATSFIGSAAAAALGRHWRLAAGFMLVLFGLVAGGLIRIRIPKPRVESEAANHGIVGALGYGVALGGTNTACSFGCNPILPIATGAALVNGLTLPGVTRIAAFALGYGLPLGAMVIGIGLGLGRIGALVHRTTPIMRLGGAATMIAVGFHLLAGG